MSNPTPHTYNQEWHNLWDDLITAPVGQERAAFVRYCLGQLTLAGQNRITKEEAVLSIARAYGIKRYDDSDQMEEIMQLAFQLEVPANMNNQQWQKLRRLVAAMVEQERVS